MSSIEHQAFYQPVGTRARGLLVGVHIAAAASVLVLFNLALANARFQGLSLPDYAIWSGVLQVETKLRLLEELVQERRLDVLILGSSMGDHGVSAAALNRASEKSGRTSIRAFNFSLGGADLPTYPIMYRLARLVSKPKEVWLVASMGAPRKDIVPGSLDERLLKGPLSQHKGPGTLWLSRQVCKLPMIRYAPALRDALMNRSFPNRPSTSLDLYDIDPSGDTISWVYNPQRYEVGAKLAIDRRREASRFNHPDAFEQPDILGDYFNSRTVAAIRELRSDLRADGVQLKIIAFDHAVGLGQRDPEYLRLSKRYFEHIAQEFAAPLLDVRADFELSPYMMADPSHLNSLGAAAFSHLLVDHLNGLSPRVPPKREVSRRIQTQSADAGWTPFTALIAKDAHEASQSLELRYLENWGSRGRLHPGSGLKVAIRLPDDSVINVLARSTGDGKVVADISALPRMDRDVVLRVQLYSQGGNYGGSLPLPLAEYRWSEESHAPEFYAPPPRGHVEPVVDSYTVVQPVQVRWEGVPDPQDDDWIGVFPFGKENAPRVTYTYLQARRQGIAQMRPVFSPGRYELRVMRANGWDVVAVSEPFDVVPHR